MCIICLEFNKHRDFGRAEEMIESAKREPNSIPEDHLKWVEQQIANVKKLKDNG